MPVPFGSYPFDASGVDNFAHPIFIVAERAPTSNDFYNPGTQWMNNAVNPKVIYQTTGGGNWPAIGGAGTFTTLTVSGQSSLAASNITGTTNINTSGASVTTIGTGGTGAVSIGNATGNTTFTGNVTATNGNITLGTAGNKVNVATGANASAGTSAALTAGSLVVNTTAITANSLVFFSTNTLGTVTVPQAYRVSARTPGTSFTIQSQDPTDTSTVNYWIIN